MDRWSEWKWCKIRRPYLRFGWDYGLTFEMSATQLEKSADLNRAVLLNDSADVKKLTIARTGSMLFSHCLRVATTQEREPTILVPIILLLVLACLHNSVGNSQNCSTSARIFVGILQQLTLPETGLQLLAYLHDVRGQGKDEKRI